MPGVQVINVQAVPWRCADLSVLESIIVGQHERRNQLDARLPYPTAEELHARVKRLAQTDGFVLQAICSGRIVGIASPELVIYSHESDMLTYWPVRKGEASEMVLCGETDADKRMTLLSLLDGLDSYWRDCAVTGAGIVWPTRELCIANELAQHHFLIDAYMALRPMVSGPGSQPRVLPGLSTRYAEVRDEQSVVDLYLEVISAHIPHSPFARHTPSAEPRFRERLQRIWRGDSPGSGASFVLVAELDGEVVAMAECWLEFVGHNQDHLLPPGRYGYVNSFGVSSARRRSGIGGILEAAVTEEFAKLQLNGSCLWYSHYNSSARNFWPGVGYEPLWTSYQRRDGPMR